MELTKDDIKELDNLLAIKGKDADVWFWPLRRDLVDSMDAIIEIFRIENKIEKEELTNNMRLYFTNVKPYIKCDWKDECLFSADIDMNSNSIKFRINEDLISKDKISEIKDLKLLDKLT